MDDATQSKSADNPPRYVRCPDTIKFAVGEDSLTYSGVTKAVSILTPLQASLLNLCDAPRTLAEHAQFCRAQIANLSGEEINQQLHALAENKSLLSATFMQDCSAHADADDYKPG